MKAYKLKSLMMEKRKKGRFALIYIEEYFHGTSRYISPIKTKATE
jgi:hypothetical protein